MTNHEDTVIVTGSTGFIGSALINKFAARFALIGLDRATAHQPPPAAECVCIDLTSEKAVAAGLRRVRTAYGNQIASVIHLASLRHQQRDREQRSPLGRHDHHNHHLR